MIKKLNLLHSPRLCWKSFYGHIIHESRSCVAYIGWMLKSKNGVNYTWSKLRFSDLRLRDARNSAQLLSTSLPNYTNYITKLNEWMITYHFMGKEVWDTKIVGGISFGKGENLIKIFKTLNLNQRCTILFYLLFVCFISLDT